MREWLSSRAVSRHHKSWSNVLQSLQGWSNDRLENSAGQVQPSKHRVNLFDAREFLGITNGIDRARVTAAGHHDEPFFPDVHHQSLIIMDERIGLPCAVDLRIMDRKPFLEFGCTMNLAGHQHHTVHQIGTATLFDNSIFSCSNRRRFGAGEWSSCLSGRITLRFKNASG